jgi:hypothetical protein
LLPKLYYYHGGLIKKLNNKIPNQIDQPKKPNQNGWIQIDLSTMTLWSSWTLGQKNHMGGFFNHNSWSKKLGFLIVIVFKIFKEKFVVVIFESNRSSSWYYK